MTFRKNKLPNENYIPSKIKEKKDIHRQGKKRIFSTLYIAIRKYKKKGKEWIRKCEICGQICLLAEHMNSASVPLELHRIKIHRGTAHNQEGGQRPWKGFGPCILQKEVKVLICFRHWKIEKTCCNL